MDTADCGEEIGHVGSVMYEVKSRKTYLSRNNRLMSLVSHLTLSRMGDWLVVKILKFNGVQRTSRVVSRLVQKTKQKKLHIQNKTM